MSKREGTDGKGRVGLEEHDGNGNAVKASKGRIEERISDEIL